MNKKPNIRKLFFLMTVFSTMGWVHQTHAAAFQLWEQDGASVGNYHAGYAAIAEDASTSFYNPAGLVRIPNQQAVLGLVPITTDFLFDGTIAVNTIENDMPNATEAQVGTLNFVPDIHYAAPIFDNLVFGLSVVAPFGLQTKYGKEPLTRYAATTTSLQVIDISPTLGFAINNQLSIGIGADIELSQAEFDLVATAFSSELDTDATNSVSGHGLGYHAGILYQLTPGTRFGLAYHSKVTHHFRGGKSKFDGPLANGAEGGVQSNHHLRTDATLPATTSFSVFHAIHPAWDVMGTVSYIQWGIFEDVVLKNVSGINTEFLSSDTITVIIPEHYRNTWNYSIGANYHVNEQWFFRTGAGYDQTPSNDHDRNLQLPDGDRVVFALGTHFQPIKAVGLDLGWSHFFTQNVPLDVTQPVGGQTTTTVGSVKGNADVYGFQVTWNIT